MRRLSFILVLVILVGGLSLGEARASAPGQAAPSSILLAQAAVQPSPGLFSGIASAFDKLVASVMNAVTSLFGVGASAPKSETTPSVAASSIPVVPKPTLNVAPLTAPVPAPASVMGAKTPASVVASIAPTADGPLVPSSEQAMSGEAPDMGKGATPFNLFAASAPKLGPVVVPSAAKLPVASNVATTAVAKSLVAPASADSFIAKTPATPMKDVLKYADVDKVAAPAVAASSGAVVQSAPVTSVTSSAPSTPETSLPAAIVQAAPAARETTISQAPMLYSQPIGAALAPAAAETPVTRPSAPIALTPIVRPPTLPIAIAPVARPTTPVTAVPRFIDTIIQSRPLATTIPTIASTVITTAALPTRFPVDVITLTPMDLPPSNLATVDPATTRTTASSPQPVAIMPRMTILSDGVVIQVGAAATTIIDISSPTTDAVMCNSTGDFPILSMGEDAAGVTRGVVAGGAILLKPTDFFKKFIKLEGVPLTTEATAKDCNLVASHSRLSTPDLVMPMPKPSENESELVSASTVVGANGRVFTVAGDNTAEKTLRGIVVREAGATPADGKILFKAFPAINQVATAVHIVTFSGEFPGPFTADLLLGSDGATTTLHCEFSTDSDMVCTTRGAL